MSDTATKVIIDEGVVNVVTVAEQGPPGAPGENGADVAYVDAGDATSRQRANHTGTQPSSTISDFPTAVDARVAIQKGVANGIATLGSDNKVPSAQLPAIAITDTFVVASQAAMLALTAEVGDIAVRTDLNKSFVLKTAGASTLGNWQELLTPTDSVSSVNGRAGAVTGLAEDSAVAHNTGNETWAGVKTFSSAPVVPSAALPESAISGLTTDLAAKAPLDSPALTGTPTAPTATPGANSTQLATTAYADAAVSTGTPDATTTTKGKLQLAGDLGGTAGNPTVKSRTATVTVGPSGSTADYVCDGVADDVGIQAALTTVGVTGGVVFLKQGTYDLTAALTIPSNVTLAGAGRTTIIKANASFSGTLTMIINSNISSGNSYIVVRDLVIDGNQANRTGKIIQDTAGHNLILKKCNYSKFINVISFNGIVSCLAFGLGTNNCVMEGCVAFNSWDHNILLLGQTSSGTECYQNTVRSCVSYGAGQGGAQGVGIELAELARYNTIMGNLSHDNMEGGIHLYSEAHYNTVVGNTCAYNNSANNGGSIAIVDQSNYNTVVGNTIYGSGASGILATTSGAGGYTYGTKHSRIADNIIYNCAWNGIRGNSTNDFQYSSIAGNNIDNCGAGGSGNATSGIFLQSTGIVGVTDNQVTNCTGSGIQTSTVDRISIVGNHVESNLARGIYLDTSSTITNCVISDNILDFNSQSGILLATKASKCIVANNIVKSSQGTNSGIDLRGVSHCTITGNECDTNTQYGIKLMNDVGGVGCTYNLISNNTCYVNTQGGINESGNADNNIYIGNNCNGNTTNNFAMVGANNEIGHNITT
jgi:parallel beta-helix repeat protein